MGALSNKVDVRLSDEDYQLLVQAAGQVKDGTLSGEARRRLVDSLQGEATFSDRISHLEDGVEALKHDLQITTRALLVATGKITVEEAKEWALENMKCAVPD